MANLAFLVFGTVPRQVQPCLLFEFGSGSVLSGWPSCFRLLLPGIGLPGVAGLPRQRFTVLTSAPVDPGRLLPGVALSMMRLVYQSKGLP